MTRPIRTSTTTASTSKQPIVIGSGVPVTGVYGLTLGLTLRGFFPGALASLLSRIPGGDRLSSWLRLPMAGVASPAP